MMIDQVTPLSLDPQTKYALNGGTPVTQKLQSENFDCRDV